MICYVIVVLISWNGGQKRLILDITYTYRVTVLGIGWGVCVCVCTYMYETAIQSMCFILTQLIISFRSLIFCHIILCVLMDPFSLSLHPRPCTQSVSKYC